MSKENNYLDLIGAGTLSGSLKIHKDRRVYLFKIEMPDTRDIVYKVGVASGKRSLDRFLQVLRSIHIHYNQIGRAKIKRDRKSKDPFVDEKKIHKLLSEYSYTPSEKFDGWTELFECDEETALAAYHSVVG